MRSCPAQICRVFTLGMHAAETPRLMRSKHPLPKPSCREESATKHPDFFIIGAPKCGTTALAEYLSHHPDIFMARKEMHYFGSDLRFGSQIYCRKRADYLREFAGWSGQSRAGEASVWYLFSKKAAEEIKAFSPDARIIIMLREPTEMLHSLYYQFFLDGNEHLPTFGAALAAQADRRAGRRLTRQTYFPQGLAYQEVARYSEQIRRYLDVFGPDRVHVVLYDEFAANTAAMYAEVLNFLGVAPAAVDKTFPVINASQTIKSPLLRAIMSDPLMRGTAIAMHTWLPRPLFAILQKLEGHLMQFNIRRAKRPKLDIALRNELKIQFASEVKRLGELLGRDLSSWSALEKEQAASQEKGLDEEQNFGPDAQRVASPQGSGKFILATSAGSKLNAFSKS